MLILKSEQSFKLHLLIIKLTFNLCEKSFKCKKEQKKSHKCLLFRDNHYSMYSFKKNAHTCHAVLEILDKC